MQQLIPAAELLADFAGETRLGQSGHVDGHIGLVEELCVVERGQVGQGAQPVAPVLLLYLFDGDRAHGDRGGHVAVVFERAGQRRGAAGADRYDDPDAQGAARAHRRRLLVGEEGGETCHG